MAKGFVIVIEADDWIARLLVGGLTEQGYRVVRAKEALDGFQRVCEQKPDCILCDVNLPDFDGHWVAHMVRAERSTVATTPFLFLANADDESSPLEAFHVGADTVITKPFRLQEVIAKVAELVGMGKDLREQRDSYIEKSKSVPPAKEAFRGDLAQMSLATILTLLEMDRSSGKLEITAGGETGTIDLAEGLALEGMLRGEPTSALEVLREIMKWKDGRFSFVPGAATTAPATAKSIAGMLFHAVCLDDAKAVARGARNSVKAPAVEPAPKPAPGPEPTAPPSLLGSGAAPLSVSKQPPKAALPVAKLAASPVPRPATGPSSALPKVAASPPKASTLPALPARTLPVSPAEPRGMTRPAPLRAPRPKGPGASLPPKKGP